MCGDQGTLDIRECTLLLVFMSMICSCFVGLTLGVDCCRMRDSDNMYQITHPFQRTTIVVKEPYNLWLSSCK